MASRTSGDVLRQGMRVLGRAIREQPRIFALAVGGSVLFSLLIIANSYVVGWVVGDVVVPSIADGRLEWGLVVLAAVALFAVSVLRVVGIFGRRLGAGYMQYRLQAAWRRRVTRRYLELPLSWHQRHATGTLLSNANSDVEVDVPPDRAAAVRRRHGGDARRRGQRALRSPTGRWRWSGWRSSRRSSRSTSSTPARWRPGRRGPSRCAPRSATSPTRASTARWWSRRWAGRRRRPTGSRARANELRDSLISVGRLRGLFDPLLESLPSLGTLAVLLVGTVRLRHGRDQRHRTGQRRLPVHRAGLPGPGDRLGARRAAAQRRRLGTGPQGRRGDRRDALRRRDHRPGRPRPGRADVPRRGLRLRTGRGGEPGQVLTDVGFTVAPGRTVALVGPTGSRQVDDRLAGAAPGRPRLPGEVALDGVDAAPAHRCLAGRQRRAGAAGAVRLRRHRTGQRHPRPGGDRRRRGLGGAAAGRGGRLRRRAARRTRHRWSASGAPRSPAGSGSG